MRSRSFTADGIEPVSSSASIFSAIVLPTPASSVTRPCARQLGDRDAGLADRLGGVAVGDHAVDDRAVELVQARQLLEGVRDLSVAHRRTRVRASMAGAWLVLPTYNEAENIGPLVRAVLPQLASTGLEHHVLIVDDGSPDGTGRLADELAAEHEPVQVLHRTRKEGLGRAYLAGFEVALAAGAEQRAGDGLRLLPRARGPAAAAGRRRGGRPRARLTLRAGRRGDRLGSACGERSRAAARPTRAGCWGCRCAT